jgi:3'-5' exoribonuclease
MPMVRRFEPISTWEDGDFVEGYALVARKERRLDKKGREYLDLELADAKTALVAKVWPDSPALDANFDEKEFVLFKGTARLYRGTLQVTVDLCRRITEKDRKDGFNQLDYVPTTPEDLGGLPERLAAIFPAMVERPELQRLAEEALSRHGEALADHPAAKTIHHAYRGGLLEHVVKMAEIAVDLCRHYPEVDRDVVLLGVLFHDLGKLRELGSMPQNDYTFEGQLVGHLVIGHQMLRDCALAVDLPEKLRLHLEHLVLSHHERREYGSPVEPSTIEAVVLCAVDSLDSKLNQLRQARRRSSGFQYLRPMGRSFYLGQPG